MRKSLLLWLSMLLVCASCNARGLATQPDRALFVGNSLTYVGNLPAVFSALAAANGHAVRSFMVVSPGGTLSERVADGSALRALRKCGCTTMVLQERGGDLFGLFGDDALVQSKRAIVTLARAGRAKGADVLLLGTYNSPGVSHHLVEMEAAAAHAAGIPYIAVSERLWRLHKAYPSLAWLRKAGGHPGKALTLLDAILLYQQVYGNSPTAKALVVHAPIYGTHTGLKPELRRANAPPPNPGVPRMVSYPATVMGKLLAAIEEPGRCGCWQSLRSGRCRSSGNRDSIGGERSGSGLPALLHGNITAWGATRTCLPNAKRCLPASCTIHSTPSWWPRANVRARCAMR